MMFGHDASLRQWLSIEQHTLASTQEREKKDHLIVLPRMARRRDTDWNELKFRVGVAPKRILRTRTVPRLCIPG
jgi:hypothetical protein